MQRPRMKELSQILINPVYVGIPMKPNWPLEDLLNNFMVYLIESGIYIKILDDTFDNAIRIGHLKYFPSDNNTVEPLNLQYFRMPAFLLLMGYSVALISFILEIWIYKYVK